MKILSVTGIITILFWGLFHPIATAENSTAKLSIKTYKNREPGYLCSVCLKCCKEEDTSGEEEETDD